MPVMAGLDSIAHDSDGAPVLFERSRGRFQDANNFQTLASASEGRVILANAIKKMLAFEFERLLLFDVRDIAVSVMIRVLKLCECVVMRRRLDAHIVNPNFFQRLDIVINNHPLCADDRHVPHFAWVEPTALNIRKTLAGEVDAHSRDVFYSSPHMRFAPTI